MPKTFLNLILIVLPLTSVFAESEDTSELHRKIFVHGFLTQAYAISNGNQVIGISEDGTADYRSAALQLRYSPSDNDHFVVQFDHERTGDSLLADKRDLVKVDWAFYEHRFSNGTSVKAGRVQIPIGIFNEVRHVGTILPFFRPSFDLYGVDSFTNETLDGAVVSHRFYADRQWSLDLSLYYGGWDYIERDQDRAVEARIKNGVGVQAWLNTPIQGLRLGYHYNHSDAVDGLHSRPGQESQPFNISYYSIDGSFNRFFLRWEAKYHKFSEGHFFANYAQAGVSLTNKIAIAVQRDESHLKVVVPNFASYHGQMDIDYAVSLRYFFRHNLVVKAEVHRNKGLTAENPVPNIFFDKPLNTTYGILSISTSF